MSAGKFATALLAAGLVASPSANAVSFTPVPSPNIDLSELGRVAIAGNFDALSLYEYVGQEQSTYLTNGSHSLLSRFPNGAFANLAVGDANIEAMCSFVKDGSLNGVVIGGNFTSLGGVETQGVALFNPNSSDITPLEGLTGRVKSLYCDSESGIVYVGGSFSGANSTNAISWEDNKWTNLPFAGFNGPVSSIVKNSDGHIIFGGTFDGLGNTTAPKTKDQQVIPLSPGNITAPASTSTTGFSDPRNIICKEGEGGAGNVWLLKDNTAGHWKAEFGFGFEPTKLRLYNTDQDGRGTKTWRFTALPDNGIMNFTHIDSNGNNVTCDALCPLPEGNTTYQDFHFVNRVGMNSFRIDISDWYGDGGGLAGLELYQDDMYAFAINSFNQPTCDSVNMSASATTSGTWVAEPSHTSSSDWLVASFPENTVVNSTSAEVVFSPNIQQSGNYYVRLYTPGCLQDGTCTTRGQVNITGSMTQNATSTGKAPISTVLFQTNYYDKYDTIFSGYVDAISGSFRPSVTLTPADGQDGPLDIVAQRVRFELMSSSAGGLNGLFEYDPEVSTVSDDFSASVVDSAGVGLSDNAGINAMATDDGAIFIGGNFTNSNFSYIFAIRDNTTISLADHGLNAEVHALYLNGTDLFVGGNFTNTADNNVDGLAGVAHYSTSDNTWSALGAGVRGSVYNIVPLTLNLTDKPEYVIALSGELTEVMAFGDNETFAVDGVALWSPSRQNWVHNLNVQSISVSGHLTAWTEVPDSDALFAGAVSSQALEASGAVGLINSDQLGLQRYRIEIDPQTESNSSLAKRSTDDQKATGVVTGMVYEQDSLNITIIGGHFSATGTNASEINDLMFVNASNSDSVTGLSTSLDPSATIVTLATQEATLWVGGRFTGNASGTQLNGLFAYSLVNADFEDTQPQALNRTDGEVSVNSVAPRPKSSDVYVGGEFDSAGAFGCPALCVFATDRGQWNSPGNGLSGSVSSMLWVTENELILGGNLTVEDNTTALVTYKVKNSVFQTVPGSEQIPGPVDAITAANSDGTQFWVAGTATNGSAFVMLTGTGADDWMSVGEGLGEGSIVRSLQVFSVTEDHDSNDNLSKDKILMILGELSLPGFGNASAIIYNGTDFQPFILSTTASNSQGSLSQIFVEKPQNVFRTGGKCFATI